MALANILSRYLQRATAQSLPRGLSHGKRIRTFPLTDEQLDFINIKGNALYEAREAVRKEGIIPAKQKAKERKEVLRRVREDGVIGENELTDPKHYDIILQAKTLEKTGGGKTPAAKAKKIREEEGTKLTTKEKIDNFIERHKQEGAAIVLSLLTPPNFGQSTKAGLFGPNVDRQTRQAVGKAIGKTAAITAASLTPPMFTAGYILRGLSENKTPENFPEMIGATESAQFNIDMDYGAVSDQPTKAQKDKEKERFRKEYEYVKQFGKTIDGEELIEYGPSKVLSFNFTNDQGVTYPVAISDKTGIIDPTTGELMTLQPRVPKQEGGVQKGDLNKDGRLSSYEETRQNAIEKSMSKRQTAQEGGEMAMPPELMQTDVPVDTYPNATPEEIAAADQRPDAEMEENYMEFIIDESLNVEEQQYLMNTLEGDPQLSMIFDKVVETASEFSGAGEVQGPGNGLSDSIPARLSDGEFVMTKKATDQIGADNLQKIMDDAERAYDGGMMRQQRQLGGLMADEKANTTTTGGLDQDLMKAMSLKANKAPSLS
jgi:hypothetical protein